MTTAAPPSDDDPDKDPMADDDKKRKMANDCWKRGSDALSKEDFEYAIKMYRQSVNFCPDNLVFRQSLRGAETKFYKDNQKGQTGLFVKGKIGKVRVSCKTARARSKWDDLDHAAEDGLAINPWDAQFNADVGEACYQRGFLEVAVFAFERATASDPQNASHFRALAEVEEQRGNYIKASQLWGRVYKLDPTDTEARRREQDNLTKDTMGRGNYEEAESTRDIEKKDDAYAEDRTSFSRKQDKDELTAEEELERQVRKNPESVEPRLKLGEYYRQQKDWERAREVFAEALQVAGGGDHNIREIVEDCDIEILRHNWELARQRAGKSGDPKLDAMAGKLERELVLREMEVLRGRIERYPNDSRLKFDLAKKYMRFQKFKEAIPLFQQCVNDSRLQASVLVALGKCFIGVQNEGIAARQFAKAVTLLNHIDNPTDFCECHYFLGRLAENNGDTTAAENHYNEILSVNYGYKDVQQRLDQLGE